MLRYSVCVEVSDRLAVTFKDEDGLPTNENCVLRTNDRDDAVGEMELWKQHSISPNVATLPKRVFLYDEIKDDIIAEFSPMLKAMGKVKHQERALVCAS